VAVADAAAQGKGTWPVPALEQPVAAQR
jgi:hypothetical protein